MNRSIVGVMVLLVLAGCSDGPPTPPTTTPPPQAEVPSPQLKYVTQAPAETPRPQVAQQPQVSEPDADPRVEILVRVGDGRVGLNLSTGQVVAIPSQDN